MKLYCKACGGLLGPQDEQCLLCGTPAGVDPEELEKVELGTEQASPDPAPEGEVAPAGTPVTIDGLLDSGMVSAGSATTGLFCNSCGWKNPPGARFCSRCGSRLQAEAAAEVSGADSAASGSSVTASSRREPPADDLRAGSSVSVGASRAAALPPGTAPLSADAHEAGVGRRVGIIVGSGIMVVVALYLMGALTKGGGPQAAVPLNQQPVLQAAPLAAGISQQVEALDDSIASATGTRKVDFARRQVDLLLGATRFDLAAAAQERVAQETASERDWAFAGNLYYDAMELAPEGSPERIQFAKKAIASYQETLAINPDNLDVRTDMAVAYLSDPDNPMSAILETQAVLERDSLHVQANFNRGIMLLQINRVDQAIEQFRKVQRIVGDPENAVYQRAQDAINTIAGSSTS